MAVLTIADWLRTTALAEAAAALDGDTIAKILTEVEGDPVKLRNLLLGYLTVSRPAHPELLGAMRHRAVAAEFDQMVAGLDVGG